MNTKRFFMHQYIIMLLCPLFLNAAEWQWSTRITSQISFETNDHPTAFLWIPPTCKKVKAVVVGCHNMLEEPIFEHLLFRKSMEQLDIALIWITPGIDPLFDPAQGSSEAFDEIFLKLAGCSGYTELKTAPVIPIGHSAYASYPWNYAAWHPERTLAILSIKGDSPRTHLTGCGRPNLDWQGRTVEGIPGLIVMAEYEWWTDRLFTAFDYRCEYPDAPISVLADAGRGHFDISDTLVNYLALFIRKAVENRLTDSGELKPVSARDGCLASPYYQNEGNRATTCWYFDKEMADLTEAIYNSSQEKKEQYAGFIQNGKLLPYNPESHTRIVATFDPAEDGLTFHLSACFTDSSRTRFTEEHAGGPISITRICGPVEKVNDTTFTVRFYRMGLNNPRRTGSIFLLAENGGDDQYKSTVQELTLSIPLRNEKGEEQTITFPDMEDVKEGTAYLDLHAVSTSGLPVYYYVKEGPAEIEGNRLRFTKIPPKAKYPVKVTVVGWQYGRSSEPKIQTAGAIERTFYINK